MALMYSAGLAGYPLVAAITNIAGLDNLQLSVAFRGTFLLLACFYLFSRHRKSKQWYKGNLMYFVAIFWFLYLWRILEYQENHVEGTKIILFALGATLVPSLLFLRALTPEESRRAFNWAFLTAALAVVGVGHIILFSGRYELGEMARAGIESLNPISFGHIGASLGLLGFYSVMRGGARKGMKTKITAYAATFLGLGAVLVSASRGPLLAFLVCVTTGSIVFTTKRTTVRNSIGKAKIVLVCILLTGLVWQGLVFVQDNFGFHALSRVELIFNPHKDQAAEGRFVAWSGAFGQFVDSPIIGDSLLERSTGFYPHNALLEALMVTGIIGSLGFFVWFVAVIISIMRLLKHETEYAWIALLALQYLIGAMLSGAIWGNSMMWYFGMASIGNASLLFKKRNLPVTSSWFVLQRYRRQVNHRQNND